MEKMINDIRFCDFVSYHYSSLFPEILERVREKEGFFFFFRMREKEGWGVVSQKRGCCVG